jgi:uncharacterized protein (TIGR02217 family)
MTFYRALLPPCFNEGSEAYPVRPVDIVRSASGSPIRRSRRSQSYREFQVTFSIRRRNDILDIISHYEVMGGSEHSFPMRDKFDFRSGRPDDPVTSLDATLLTTAGGPADGVTATFQAQKQYRFTLTDNTVIAVNRTIKVIKTGSLLVAVNGVLQTETTNYTVNYDTGVITFTGGSIPAGGSPAATVTAGFEFYVPVCYGPQNPVQTLVALNAGSVASILLYEVD